MEQNKNVVKTDNHKKKNGKRNRHRLVDKTIVNNVYKVGETVEAKVLLFFKASEQHSEKSALVKLAKGGIALLHFRSILGRPERTVESFCKVGEKLTVEVEEIKPEQNRISVSLIPIMRRQYAAQLERGTICEATIVQKEAYGYFVDLGGGMRALLHKNDLRTDTNNKFEKFEIGDITRVVVLAADEEGKRLSVGREQLPE